MRAQNKEIPIEISQRPLAKHWTTRCRCSIILPAHLSHCRLRAQPFLTIQKQPLQSSRKPVASRAGARPACTRAEHLRSKRCEAPPVVPRPFRRGLPFVSDWVERRWGGFHSPTRRHVDAERASLPSISGRSSVLCHGEFAALPMHYRLPRHSSVENILQLILGLTRTLSRSSRRSSSFRAAAVSRSNAVDRLGPNASKLYVPLLFRAPSNLTPWASTNAVSLFQEYAGIRPHNFAWGVLHFQRGPD